MFELVAMVARYFSLGRDVMRMRISEFGAWADALPEVQRFEDMRVVRLLTVAGQRGLSDDDYRRALREMERPVRLSRSRALSRGELDELEKQADAASEALLLEL